MIHSMKNGVLGSCANELKFTLIYYYYYFLNIYYFFLLRFVSSFLQVQYVIFVTSLQARLSCSHSHYDICFATDFKDLKNKALLNARKRG